MGRVRGEAVDFVAARWAELRRTARLVAGDPDRGEALALEVLTDTVRRWQNVAADGQPTAMTRAALVARLLSEKAPSAPPSPDAAADDAANAASPGLADAWASLDPRERAAYVLVEDLRLSPEEAADLAGMPTAGLRDRLTTAHDRLGAAHAHEEEAAGRSATPWSLADALARALDARDGEDGRDPVSEVEAALRRRGRRRTAVAAGVLAVAAAVAAAVLVDPLGAARPARTTVPVDTPTVVATSAGPAPTARAVWAWPARGALSTDPRLVSEVVGRYAGAMQILWASDVGTRRVVFLAPREGWRNEIPRLLFLTGPAGARLADLEEHPVLVDQENSRLVAAVDERDTPSATLVVLARPDVSEASWSRTVTVAKDFTITRSWEPVPLVAGFATIPLGGPAPAALLRADGTPVTISSVLLPGPDPDEPRRADCPDCAVPDEIKPYVGGILAEVSAATGVPVPDLGLDLALTAAGDPRIGSWLMTDATPATEPMPVHVVRVRLPSGAVLQTVGVLTPREGGGAPRWGTLWSNEPVDSGDLDLPLVAQLTAPDGATLGAQVLVPEGSPVREVEWTHSPSTPGVRARVTDGTVVLENAIGWRGEDVLHSYDADGALVATRPVYADPHWAGPWDLYRGVWGEPVR